jgi:hypothetical protein
MVRRRAAHLLEQLLASPEHVPDMPCRRPPSQRPVGTLPCLMPINPISTLLHTGQVLIVGIGE